MFIYILCCIYMVNIMNHAQAICIYFGDLVLCFIVILCYMFLLYLCIVFSFGCSQHVLIMLIVIFLGINKNKNTHL